MLQNYKLISYMYLFTWHEYCFIYKQVDPILYSEYFWLVAGSIKSLKPYVQRQFMSRDIC